jgi:ubiquinone/menaquinone biosynthesis C-methylase UbiE
MSWREYWNQDTPIYVNARHKTVHYDLIARQLVEALPNKNPAVLDFGCGEALSADRVAKQCQVLHLCDGAELVRSRLAQKFGLLGNVVVMSPEQLGEIPEASLDLIVVNSVLQYLSRPDLDGLLATWRRLLKPDGQLLIADVIPPDVGPLTDVTALLKLAAANGFFVASFVGLARTFFSDYRKTRAALGLAHYSEADMLAILTAAGFNVRRRESNLGHNQARMAFRAISSLSPPLRGEG